MQHCESAIRRGARYEDATKSCRQKEAFMQCYCFLQYQPDPHNCNTLSDLSAWGLALTTLRL